MAPWRVSHSKGIENVFVLGHCFVGMPIGGPLDVKGVKEGGPSFLTMPSRCRCRNCLQASSRARTGPGLSISSLICSLSLKQFLRVSRIVLELSCQQLPSFGVLYSYHSYTWFIGIRATKSYGSLYCLKDRPVIQYVDNFETLIHPTWWCLSKASHRYGNKECWLMKAHAGCGMSLYFPLISCSAQNSGACIYQWCPTKLQSQVLYLA